MRRLASSLQTTALLAVFGLWCGGVRAQENGVTQAGEPPAAVESAPDDAAKSESVPAASSDPEDEGSEEVIPSSYPEDRYLTMWDKNPFQRKVIVIEQTRESFAKDWALAGISASNGVYTVRLFNKQSGSYARIKQGEPSGDFRIVAVNYDKDRNKSSVEVARGNEKATLTYDDSLLSRPVTIENTMGGAGAPGQAPANPNAPGMPMTPGMPGSQASLQRGPGGQPVMGTQGAGRPGLPTGVPGRVGTTPGAMGTPVTTPQMADPSAYPAQGMQANPGYVAPGVPATGAPPPVSRRRQLIPGPIQQNP